MVIHAFGTAKSTRGKALNTNLHHLPVPLIVQEIIEKADIILEVLDARFIEKTRNPDVEKAVKKMKKTLIYIFNKADLVDVKKVNREVELEGLKPNLFFSSKGKSKKVCFETYGFSSTWTAFCIKRE